MWLSEKQASELVARHGTPLFVYSRKMLQAKAEELLALELPFGHTVRYAVKANSHPEIIKLFDAAGLHFDASSSYEADELLRQGIAGDKISLSSQQSAHNLPDLLSAGVQYVATSMHQLELFTVVAEPGSRLALRVNPPVGYGHNNRLTTAGKNSSFGLWHEHLTAALQLAKAKNIIIDRLHIHVGTGADPSAWAKVIDAALSIVRDMPDVTTLDIGGGYKIAYESSERETDMQQVAEVFAEQLQKFADETGRQLKLEIESGRWLVAHAGILLAQVNDIVDTGKNGHKFLRLNTGMNDIIRPAMYGAQHEIEILNDTTNQTDYIVVGHNCETSDILTPAAGDPESIAPRHMNKARIGDVAAVADTGAYCASFSAKDYNAFPSAREIFIA
ncbi:MAG TPA: diaminopimelate decarboxylase [Candidatus Saccharimonadales bacterium]|jgi:diaminopimelate decarboxylase